MFVPDRVGQSIGMMPERKRRKLVHAAVMVIEQIDRWAQKGQNVLSVLSPHSPEFVEWAHYPAPDASPPRSYSFYYHAHAASQRIADEHGHFHLFGPAPAQADPPARADTSRPCGRQVSESHFARGRPTNPVRIPVSPKGCRPYTHLIALSVDSRGLPLRLFTTNRWVTDEHWQPAGRVERLLDRLDLSEAQPSEVAAWLQWLVPVFAPQITRLLQQRDQRLQASMAGRTLARILEDRRMPILSQCRVDLVRQMQILEKI